MDALSRWPIQLARSARHGLTKRFVNKDLVRSIGLRIARIDAFAGPADRRLASAGVLSLDAFDTLITRSVYQPADVFEICGAILRESSAIQIGPATWRALRERTEADLVRHHHPEEVRLDEIYDALVRANALARHRRDEARDLEREVERLVGRPIAQTVQALKRFLAGAGTALVLSDTYLPAGDVLTLLDQSGVAVPQDRLHTSSQSRKTKRNGELFAHALRDIGASPRKVLHVGDNLSSDLRQARAAGLTVAPYLAGRPTRFERQLHKALASTGLLGSVMAGSARATRLGRSFRDSHRQAIWDLSANVTGPLLFTFVAWTLREAARRGLRTLYFLSRDGEILLKIARVLQPAFAPSVECRYLYVSRQSLHLPAITEIGPAAMEWIFDIPTAYNLTYLLRRLDLEVETLLTVLPPDSPVRHLDPDAILTLDTASMVRQALEDGAGRDLVLRCTAERRRTCLAYLRSQSLLDPGQIGIVDIGWRGRLQRSLCRIVSTVEEQFEHRLCGFYVDLTGERIVDSGQMDTFSSLCPNSQFNWASRGPLFEVFCAAGHGTVRRYDLEADGNASPTLDGDRNPAAEGWGLAVQQDAVVAFAKEALHGFRLARINPLEHIDLLAGAALKIVMTFVDTPRRPEADAFGSFEHAYDEQHERLEEIAGRIDFRPHALLKRLGPSYRLRRISYWPEASITRSVPGWLRGTALALLHAIPGRHR